MFLPNLKSVASPVPEIIAIRVLGGGCNPQNWEEEAVRIGMVPLERALVSPYRPSIVIFPLSLCVSEILSVLCSSSPPFPTTPLVSPKFSHVSLGVVDGIWVTKSEGVGLIVGELISKISNLCDPDPPTLQTDMQSQYRALHYCIVQVQRAVIIFLWPEGPGHHFNFLDFYKVIMGNRKIKRQRCN